MRPKANNENARRRSRTGPLDRRGRSRFYVWGANNRSVTVRAIMLQVLLVGGLCGATRAARLLDQVSCVCASPWTARGGL